MEKEADGIRDKIASAKRVKITAEVKAPGTPEADLTAKASGSIS